VRICQPLLGNKESVTAAFSGAQAPFTQHAALLINVQPHVLFTQHAALLYDVQQDTLQSSKNGSMFYLDV